MLEQIINKQDSDENKTRPLASISCQNINLFDDLKNSMTQQKTRRKKKEKCFMHSDTAVTPSSLSVLMESD